MSFNTLVTLPLVPVSQLQKALNSFSEDRKYMSFDYDEYRADGYQWMIVGTTKGYIRTPSDIFLYTKDEVLARIEERNEETY